MKKNLVSIVIPYRRKKKYFQQTIESIKKQTYSKFEVIVIYDDEDKSELQFVKKVIRNINQKNLLINKKNLGAGLSRNKGIQNSKGEYISFCDADDLWSSKKIDTQLKFMKKYNLTFSHSSYNIIGSTGKKISDFTVKKKTTYKDLIKSCDIGLSTVMCTKKILQGNKFMNIKTKEDYYLWLILINKIKVMCGLQKKLVSWRKLENSLSSPLFRRIIDAYLMYSFYTKKNFLISAFYTLRLSIYALFKKIKIYN